MGLFKIIILFIITSVCTPSLAITFNTRTFTVVFVLHLPAMEQQLTGIYTLEIRGNEDLEFYSDRKCIHKSQSGISWSFLDDTLAVRRNKQSYDNLLDPTTVLNVYWFIPLWLAYLLYIANIGIVKSNRQKIYKGKFKTLFLKQAQDSPKWRQRLVWQCRAQLKMEDLESRFFTMDNTLSSKTQGEVEF